MLLPYLIERVISARQSAGHFTGKQNRSPSSAMPLRLFAYRRSWPHGSRDFTREEEAKMQPSGYLAMSIISGQHRSGGGTLARKRTLESGVILPVG